jgi:hypothetical protein
MFHVLHTSGSHVICHVSHVANIEPHRLHFIVFQCFKVVFHRWLLECFICFMTMFHMLINNVSIVIDMLLFNKMLYMLLCHVVYHMK